MIIRLERYFKYPDLKRQTPNSAMIWNGFTFTEEAVAECDYLVILDYPKSDFSVKVNKNNIMHLCLEPPNEISIYRQYANKNVAVNFNQVDTKNNNILSHGALPWHLDKDYDFLSRLQPDDMKKEDKIVWITSNQRASKGHHKRMDFLDSIYDLDFIDFFGRGIQPVEDKFQVLKNYKYAIAYENFKNNYYWTEKIIDCFLSYTMPLYYGCDSIDQFFPKDSFIQIDPKDKHVNLFLKEIVKSNKWEENLDAIDKARDLILNEYQLFPFLYNQIKAREAINGVYHKESKELVLLKGGDAYFNNYPVILDFHNFIKKAKLKLSKSIKFDK